MIDAINVNDVWSYVMMMMNITCVLCLFIYLYIDNIRIYIS